MQSEEWLICCSYWGNTPKLGDLNLAHRLWTELVENGEHITPVEYPEVPIKRAPTGDPEVNALVQSHLFCADNLCDKVYEFYLSLPTDMHLSVKRDLLHKEFPNIKKYLIARWTSQWSGTNTLIKHPDKIEAHDLFFSLPAVWTYLSSEIWSIVPIEEQNTLTEGEFCLT